MKTKVWILTIGLILSVGLLMAYIQVSKCLFYDHNRCIRCDDPNDFWVGLPENCTVCPNRYAQYIGDDLFPVWLCMKQQPSDDTELQLPPVPDIVRTNLCPKNYPLSDLLGHCYACSTKQPVRILGLTDNICMGKRYLTEHRQSEKSNRCPELPDISDPEVCLNCHGIWIHQKCRKWSDERPRFCDYNSDCPDHQWCYPFRYIFQNHYGICQEKGDFDWVCSQTDGYNNESATRFCQRQGMHIPTLEEIENNKQIIQNICPNNQGWTFFSEGGIYLDFTREFLFTREGMGNDFGGDKFYALCKKD